MRTAVPRPRPPHLFVLFPRTKRRACGRIPFTSPLPTPLSQDPPIIIIMIIVITIIMIIMMLKMIMIILIITRDPEEVGMNEPVRPRRLPEVLGIWHLPIPYDTILYYTIIYYNIACYIMLYHTVPYHTIL